MDGRRLLGAATGLAVALVGTLIPAATAQTADKTQDVPISVWDQPGPELLDGVGAWVYIAPQAPPSANQGSPDGYEYLLSFAYPGLNVGFIGLSTRPEGRFAGLTLVTNAGVPPATVPFDWSPGHFYYLLVYHLGGGQWGGWVYDYSASSWTFVGQVAAPAGWGLLTPSSRTLVDQKDQITAPTCADYPRTDAYFYPPVGYRGTSFTVATLRFNYVQPGECPSQTTMEYGWAHYRLGADPGR